MTNLTDIRNTMLVSPQKVKTYGNINLNVNDSEIGAAIRISQNVHLKDAICRDLVEHLQELVYNNIKGIHPNIKDEENEAYKALLDDFIVPALVYRTAMELCTILTLKIRSMGVVKNNDTNVQTTTAADISYMTEYYGALYNDALNRTVDFLSENKEAFKELPDGFCTCSSKSRFAQSGLWLGK